MFTPKYQVIDVTRPLLLEPGDFFLGFLPQFVEVGAGPVSGKLTGYLINNIQV